MITELSHIVIAVWALLALLAVGGIGIAVASERRKFAALDREDSWLWLRLASIPIAGLAAATVILPARSISGMEALAAFYILLLTAGPLVYFGLHIGLGLALRPRLTIRQSLRVGITGLLMVLIPVFAVQLLHPWVFMLAGAAKSGQLSMADAAPVPYRVVEQRRFTLPVLGEVWTERWQAPEGLVIERLEREVDGAYVRVDGTGRSSVCREGQDFHVFWPSAMAPPHWRLYWKAPEGLVRSDWQSAPPVAPAEEFAIRWRTDSVVLPVHMPRGVVSFGRMWPDGRETFDDNNRVEAGAAFDSCQPMEHVLTDAASMPPVSAIAIALWRRDTQQLLRTVLRAPGAESMAQAAPPAPPAQP